MIPAGCRRPFSALTLLLVLAGCGDRAAPKNPYGGTLVIGGPVDLEQTNSLVAGEKFTQEVNRFLLFLPLVEYSADLDYRPALAQSWQLEGDTAAVFHLRSDVRWQDGVPTRARDVIFTLQRARDTLTAYPNAEAFAQWTGEEEVDSLTVRVHFKPHNEPLAGLPFLPIMPAHLLDSIPPERLRQASFNKHPVGNGPFRFVEYRANDRWVFEANPDFPQELGGRPHIDRIVWRVIPDATAQVTELRTGNLDIVLNAKSDGFAALDSLPEIRGIVKPSRQYALVGWNHRRGALRDPRVRYALSLAIDRQDILHNLRAGYGKLAVGPIGPYHWAFDSTLAPLPYQPDSARALLRAAGIYDRDNDGRVELPDGRDFTIELKLPATSGINRDMAQMIDSDLAGIGVTVEQRPLDFGAMVQDFSTPARNFDAILLGWESDFRINLRDLFHSRAEAGPFQFAGYSNARVDALIDSTAKPLPRDQARPLYAELQRIMRQEQPWTFLYYYPELLLVGERVHDVQPDIRGVFVNVRDWWVSPATAARATPGDSTGRSRGPDSARAR